MLTRELMGALALLALWVNAALVLATALKQLGAVRALARDLRRGSHLGHLVHGRVVDAAEGALAVRQVEQVGRAMTVEGPDRILFTDGPPVFRVFGGVVETSAGDRVEIAAAEGGRAEVWIDGPAPMPDGEAFEAAWAEASRSRGHRLPTERRVEVGDEVWAFGAPAGGAVLGPRDGAPLVVSTVDPLAWAASRQRILLVFLLGAALGLATVTILALWPPLFGLVSTLGGALGVAYFLGVPPLATAVRDAVKTPARRLLGGVWRRPEPEG